MTNSSIKVGIVGTTGYVGLELVRLLLSHPKAMLKAASSRENSGKKISEVHPTLSRLSELTLSTDISSNDLDCVFVSVPHTQSMGIVQTLLQKNPKVKIIDLGADFRLPLAQFEKTYQSSHAAPDLIEQAVYGLPEIYPERISNAQIIANPGCFAHCVFLALAPLAARSAITSAVKVCAVTGSSGSGTHVTKKTHHPERNESLLAYSVGSHRHIPEIENALNAVSQGELSINIDLVPVSGPLSRGIYATCFATLKDSNLDVASVYQKFIAPNEFLRLRSEAPSPLFVRGSNFCDIFVQQKGAEVTVVATLDNLVKGASGNAIQCMNLMFGLEANTGLLQAPLYP